MKKLLFVVLLLALVFIAGCKEKAPEDGPFLGGSSGVSIAFQEGAPISEFVVSDSIPIKVVLKNSGENDIESGKTEVKLYGLAMQEYGLDETYKPVTQNIIGLQKNVVEEGGEAVVDMGILKYTGVYSNSLEPVLRAKVCYQYQTKSTITACATSREVIEAGGESICMVDGEKISSTKVSSSPIQITSFLEQLNGKDSVTFRIDIENKGLGELYKEDSTCSSLDIPITKSDSQDKVKFIVTTEDITCTTYEGTQSNKGYVKLEAGKKTLICTMKVQNAGSNYERQVNVELDFKYTESISKQLKILEG
jgi:hypothetical protein